MNPQGPSCRANFSSRQKRLAAARRHTRADRKGQRGRWPSAAPRGAEPSGLVQLRTPAERTGHGLPSRPMSSSPFPWRRDYQWIAPRGDVPHRLSSPIEQAADRQA